MANYCGRPGELLSAADESVQKQELLLEAMHYMDDDVRSDTDYKKYLQAGKANI